MAYVADEMEWSIRAGKKTDLPGVLKLIKALADYENALDQVEVTLEQLEADGFGPQPSYALIVAERGRELIGLSFYYIRYSTWKGKFLYLEDFVVDAACRRMGVGEALFEETMRAGVQMGVKGMCWQVLDWNELAINFYKKYEAQMSQNWLNGYLSGAQIRAICGSDSEDSPEGP
ncbi:MAG: GNAT family N-acetyltransferase [Flavobacteriales bacterium]|nr:GNAT family N-acetyltransferase [Flavobacteriales bacterium]